MTRGALLKVSGVEIDSSVEKLKEFFGTFGKVAWIDHMKGDNHVSTHVCRGLGVSSIGKQQ